MSDYNLGGVIHNIAVTGLVINPRGTVWPEVMNSDECDENHPSNSRILAVLESHKIIATSLCLFPSASLSGVLPR